MMTGKVSVIIGALVNTHSNKKKFCVSSVTPMIGVGLMHSILDTRLATFKTHQRGQIV
jgi:hypothetical protein